MKNFIIKSKDDNINIDDIVNYLLSISEYNKKHKSKPDTIKSEYNLDFIVESIMEYLYEQDIMLLEDIRISVESRYYMKKAKHIIMINPINEENHA